MEILHERVRFDYVRKHEGLMYRGRHRIIRRISGFALRGPGIDTLDLEPRDTLLGDTELFGRALREIEAPAANVRSAIIDPHLHRFARCRIGYQ
jgi:hypothetical protein